MSVSPNPPAWQRQWQDAFRDPAALLEFLQLDAHRAPVVLARKQDFALRVPRSYAARMRRGDWNDPLLRQVLPLHAEGERREGFAADAVGDGPAQNTPGLLRKYHGRALLLLSGECAVHCRYCFRREFPYADLPAAQAEWEKIYARLAADPDLEEILFSGGDPLALSDARLRWHWERAAALPQVRRIRIHTRVPVVLPARLDAGFLALASDLAARRALFFVVHVNHAREIDAELEGRLRALRAVGAVLLNQAVLLRGVNDTIDAQADLAQRLLDAGVLPYYLHQLDRVWGAHHFEVPETEGLRILAALRERLPGYAVPRYVREVAGEASKVPITAGADRPYLPAPELQASTRRTPTLLNLS